MLVENIQNRVRNKLGPIQILNDICDLTLKGTNSLEYIKTSNIVDIVQQSIQDLIDIAAECDKKIDDESYDVWENVLKSRNKI